MRLSETCKYPYTILLIILSFNLYYVSSLQAQAPSESIIANVPNGESTMIQVYDQNGTSISSVSIPTQKGQRVVAGKWNNNSSLGIFAPSNGASSFSVYDLAGNLTNTASLPEGKVSSIFSGDLDRSGNDDFIAIQHISNRARAVILHNPGIGSSTVSIISFPSTALYYAPAYAGSTMIGFLLYNPEGTANQVAAKKRKGSNKKKPKKEKKTGEVLLIDLSGDQITKFSISKPTDGQIYPFSPDGQCGFAIISGKKVRTFSHLGTEVGTLSLPNINDPLMGDFSNSGLMQEIVVPDGTTMHFINLSTSTRTSQTFTGFPDVQASLQLEIDRLRNELLIAFQNGTSIPELTKIRNKIVELEDQKRALGSLSTVGGRLTRIFTGGVGSIEGVCDMVRQNPNDGYGGFLAKNSDKDGNAVYLTPGGKNFYGGELLKFKSYKVITKLEDGGFGNPDSNGYRKHFRGKKPVPGYGKNIFRALLKASYYDEEPQKHCWFINKPAARID